MLVMKFIVRNDLKMGKGKIAGQVAHATEYILKEIVNRYHLELAKSIMESYENSNTPKIVLKSNLDGIRKFNIHKIEREKVHHFQFAKQNVGCIAVVVRDAGKTQIPTNTITVIGLFGEDILIDEITKEYKLL